MVKPNPYLIFKQKFIQLRLQWFNLSLMKLLEFVFVYLHVAVANKLFIQARSPRVYLNILKTRLMAF